MAASAYERIVFLSDLHVPFHDRKVWTQLVRFIHDYDPTRIVYNGDIADCKEVSKFSKNPQRKTDFQVEVDEVNARLDELGQWPGDFVPGNHEQRIERYLWDKAPELASLRCLRIGELFRLKERGIRLHSSAGFKLRPNFRVTHGTIVRKHAGHSAKAEFEKWGINGISGHTHREGKYTVTNDAGTFGWWEAGCLCQLDAAYIPGIANWQQGFALGEFRKRSNGFRIEPVPVIDGRIWYHGKAYA